MCARLPGETGGEALERIGTAVVGPPKKKGKHTKIPRQLAAIVACRTEGMTDPEIAEKLGIAIGTVRQILQKARKQNFLSDIVDRLEDRAVPTAVDNLIRGLDREDKDYTLATLKGLGVFRTHTVGKQENVGAVSNELRVVIEMPTLPAGDGNGMPRVAVGAISGAPVRPKALAAPVIDVEKVGG